MWTRRQILTRGSLGLLGLGLLGTAEARLALSRDAGGGEGRAAALPDGSASKGMITPETDAALERGLSYLSTRRNNDGSFGERANAHSGNTAVTSLGALAFMAGGHQPNRGPYGRVVTDALKFILGQERPETPGFLHNPSATPHGPMYGHGFATLFLAEVSGMVHDRDLREQVRAKLHRAVSLILKSQNVEGGWRYFPAPRNTEADISVTICQIMALRAARNAGVAVPKEKVDRCVAYVKRCQDLRDGWFRYQARGNAAGGLQAFARTAAGVSALFSAGIYEGPEIKLGLEFLRHYKPTGNRLERPDMHYFYGHYYAVQAMWTAGGDYWAEWYPAIRDELLRYQRADGSWIDQICTHYATAMACIILQVPNNYLPILQK